MTSGASGSESRGSCPPGIQHLLGLQGHLVLTECWWVAGPVCGHRKQPPRPPSVAENLGRITWPPSPSLFPAVHKGLIGPAKPQYHLQGRLPWVSGKLPPLKLACGPLGVRVHAPLWRAGDPPTGAAWLLLERKHLTSEACLRMGGEGVIVGTYFEKWFFFTHQWNIEVIEFRGP